MFVVGCAERCRLAVIDAERRVEEAEVPALCREGGVEALELRGVGRQHPSNSDGVRTRWCDRSGLLGSRVGGHVRTVSARTWTTAGPIAMPARVIRPDRR